MILSTQENKVNKKYSFPDFEMFYSFFQKLVETKSDTWKDVRSFRQFKFDSPGIKQKFKDYFDSHSQSNVRQLRNALHSPYDKNTTVNYWASRGWTEDEAREKISEIQQKRAIEFGKRLKEDPSLKTIPTQLKWYLDKGMTEEEAKKALSERQATFSFEKCLEKYGETEGEKIFKERQLKWQKSINDKFSIDERDKWRKKSLTGSISKASRKLFSPIKEKYEDKYTIFTDSDEYKIIYDKTHYFAYDFTIKELNLIFEYQSEHIHANSEWPYEKLDSWRSAFDNLTASEYFKKYDKKISLAEKQGFKVIQLWSSDSIEKNTEIIEKEIISAEQAILQIL